MNGAAEAQAHIRAFLSSVRARLRLRQMAVEAALVGVAALAVGLVFLIAASGARPSTLWRSGMWGLVVVAAGALCVAIARPFARWRGEEPVARFVGEQTGAGDLVLSAVELSSALPSYEAQPDLGSAALARAHLTSVADRLSTLKPGKVADWRPSHRQLAFLGTLALFDLLLFAGGIRAAQAGWAALHARPEKAVTKSAAPIVGDIEILLTYPAHTGLPPRAIPGSSGEILAPPGTQVDIKARPLVPSVKKAHLELSEASAKPDEAPQVKTVAVELKDNHLETRFVVGKPGSYRFTLERGGVRSMTGPLKEPEAHRIEVEPDRAPKVTLQAPADDLELPGPRRIQLAWSAEDDYGLQDVVLVWKSEPVGGGGRAVDEDPPEKASKDENGGDKTKGDKTAEGKLSPRKIIRDKIEGRAASGTIEWDLSEVDLKPGVRISYHLEARDNDAVSGPNVGVSRNFTVRVYSPEEKHEELLAEVQALADHAVAVLGDRLDAQRAQEGEPPAALQSTASAHTREDGFLDETTKLQEKAASDPKAAKDLKATLEGIKQRLGKLVREEEPPLAKARGAGSVDAELIAPLKEMTPQHVAEMEKDALALADLLGRQRLEQLLGVADEMQSARDRLKQLLTDYKKTKSDAVKAEIEREMRKLEQKMAELAEKASKLQGELPDEFVNREAMKGGGDDMKKGLDQIREMLAKGDVDKAMEELKKLSSKLDKMVASMEGDLKGYRNERFSAEEKALAELESKLSDLEHDERQIQSESDEVLAKQREEQKRVMKERIEPFLKKAKERVEGMKKKLATVDKSHLRNYNQEPLDKAKRRVDDLMGALEQGDLEQAREMARQAGGEMNGLALDLREEEERRWEAMKAPVKKSRERVEEARSEADQIANDIEQMMPKPGEMLGPGEKKKLEDLSARQEAVRRRTEEARRELEKRMKERDAMGEGLKQAGEHMGRAAGSMKGGNPRDGSGEAGQAIDRLSQMRKDLQSERRPREEGGNGSMNEKEVVKIPGADEYRAPREFRQDLLEAMKRDAPGAYKELVKRYYEELVK